MPDDRLFYEWIRRLDEDVIQDEFGYERGEFNVTPALWRGLYDEGLSPHDAFVRALDISARRRSA